MQSDLKKQSFKLEERLAKKICFDFLKSKNTQDKDEIIYELKKLLLNYSIDNIEFLNLKYIVECLCLLKGIDFKVEYTDAGLTPLFKTRSSEFRKIDDKLFVLKFDKEATHITIVEYFEKMCKNLSTKTDTFSLRIESMLKGGYRYYIQKNGKDVYICYHINLYENEIYIRRFMSITPDLMKLGPPAEITFGKRFVTVHKYTHKIPYLDGYFLTEIEKLILILENYGN